MDIGFVVDAGRSSVVARVTVRPLEFRSSRTMLREPSPATWMAIKPRARHRIRSTRSIETDCGAVSGATDRARRSIRKTPWPWAT